MVKPLTRKLFRDIGRHRAQFIAVMVTVFLGVAIFAASYDSYNNLVTSYETTFSEYRFANLTVAGGDTGTIAAEAAAMPGVEAAQTRTVVDVPLRAEGTKLLGRAVGMPATGQPEVNQVKVLEGSYLDPERPEGVLVEEHMADHFGLGPGDTVEVFVGDNWRVLEVAGVASSPEYIWPARSRQEVLTTPDNFGVLFTVETLARDLGGVEGPNEVAVYYTDGKADEALSAELASSARTLGATQVYTRDEQPSNAALSEDIKGFEEMALLFPVLFIVAAAMASYVMISRFVYAQRPHIGGMLANGYTRGQVLRHYLGYGWIPGLIGALPGAVAGVLLAGVITRLYTEMLSVPVTVIDFHPGTLAVGVLIGVVATLLAALAPALVASRIRPAEAMRGETPAGRGRPSLAERLLPPLRRLPIRWRMAFRGIERNPRRTIYTMLGVVLSLVLVLVSWGMIDTVGYLLDLQFVQISREDAVVYFAAPVGTEEVAALEAVSGVAAVEPALEVPVTVTARGEAYDTTLVALEAGTEMHGFRSVDGSWIELPEEGLLLGKALSSELEIVTGDLVAVTVSPLGITIEGTVAGFVDEPLGTLVYTSRDYASSQFGGSLPATSALVRYEEGVDGAMVRDAITGLPSVAAFEDSDALYDLMHRYMVFFYGFVGVMLVFGAAMSFALIFNAMTVNIAERSREVATLLAVGTKRATVSRLITAENLIVAVAGIPIGLVAGYYLSVFFMASFESDMFAFELYVSPMTFALAGLAIVVVALISGWPGLRALRRLHIPTVVKERSS
jgi:putative ABC transport system permease protein